MWNVQRDRPTAAADYASARRQKQCRSHRRPERDVQAQRFHRVQSVTQPCETVRRARCEICTAAVSFGPGPGNRPTALALGNRRIRRRLVERGSAAPVRGGAAVCGSRCAEEVMSDVWAIDTEALTKRYGGFEAVRSLDLKVARGGVTGFLGRNGAGKSTTIKMPLGMARPTAGEGWVLGQRIDDRESSLAIRKA